MHASWCGPWCIARDFNVIRHPSKRRGSYNAQMRLFDEFINEHELVDPPLQGAKFTWTNNQVKAAMSRLDKFNFT